MSHNTDRNWTNRWQIGTRLVAAFASAIAFSVNANAQSNSPSVISLDYCSDQYVLALADRSQILALSNEARHPHSFYRDRAQGIPQVRAQAEDILPFTPDIVFRQWAGGQRLLSILDRLDIHTESAEFGSDVDVVERNLIKFGTALGQHERAKIKAKEMRDELQEMRNQPRSALIAAYVTPGGVTAGTDSFINAIIQEAGFKTSAEQLEIAGWPPLPLEHLILNPPDVIIGSFFDMSAHRDSNWSAARHAHVRKMLKETPTIYVPSAYLSCNGLFYAKAVSFIRNEAEAMNLLPQTNGEAGET